MKWHKRLFLTLSRFYPASYRQKLKHMIRYAGMSKDPNFYLGAFLLAGIFGMLIIILFPNAILGKIPVPYYLVGIGFLILLQLLAYLMVFFRAEERTKRVEEALPDAFQMIASNLRSGMTPFKALKLSAHKGLGPLQDEIQYATSMALGTESFSETLLRISDRIQSELLDRSLKLFTTAMQSGGRLAQVLEELAADIAQTNALKRELRTSTKTYTAFIMFTIIIGAPLLLSISINFVEMIADMQEKTLGDTSQFGMGFLMGELTITPVFLRNLSFVILTMTSVLASMLLGVIHDGRPVSGLRYAVTITLGSFAVFLVAGYFVGNFLIGMA